VKSDDYLSAGVSLDAAQQVVKQIKPFSAMTHRPEVVDNFGGFAAMFDLGLSAYKDPLLVSATDGVGTKSEIAKMAGRYETIGNDLVAMCVDDIVCVGAEPLFFLDYIAVGHLDSELVGSLIKGIAEGCVEAGCSLIGGETAEHPGVMKDDSFDLAGFSVGAVERNKVIDGSNVQLGDQIIGIKSPNLRSNGFSLVRKVFLEIAGKSLNDPAWKGSESTLGEKLLEPSVIYAPTVLNVLKENEIHAIAHITGGGLPENIARILGDSFNAVINNSSWETPRIFSEIQTLGLIDTEEMFRVFNMGIGMVLIVPPNSTDRILEELSVENKPACVIGEIVKGSCQVEILR
jgi:phosphoribosylformylglycinamidine cyclo-ligase